MRDQLPPGLVARLAPGRPWTSPGPRPPAVDQWDLTSRQREVLIMICDGKGNKQIATTLCISIKTVEKHRGWLCERLRMSHPALMCRWAIRVGLIEP